MNLLPILDSTPSQSDYSRGNWVLNHTPSNAHAVVIWSDTVLSSNAEAHYVAFDTLAVVTRQDTALSSNTAIATAINDPLPSPNRLDKCNCLNKCDWPSLRPIWTIHQAIPEGCSHKTINKRAGGAILRRLRNSTLVLRKREVHIDIYPLPHLYPQRHLGN